jgi:hypothetical protein
MLMADSEMQDEGNEGQDLTNHQASHVLDNSVWKFGMNDFELEDFAIGTKNLFDVKNLESPILWIRVDPDMEFIRKVKILQK